MKYKLSLAIILTLLSPQLFANDFSVGLTFGQSSNELANPSCQNDSEFIMEQADFINANCVVDDSDSAIGINLSYNFTNMWGVELGYMDLGQTSAFLNLTITDPDVIFIDTGTNTTSTELTPEFIDTEAVYLAGTVTFDLSEKFSVTGRLGVSNVEYDLISNLFESEFNEDSTSVFAGLSLNYSLTEKWGVKLRYDYFDFESDLFELDFAIDAYSVGVSYSF